MRTMLLIGRIILFTVIWRWLYHIFCSVNTGFNVSNFMHIVVINHLHTVDSQARGNSSARYVDLEQSENFVLFNCILYAIITKKTTVVCIIMIIIISIVNIIIIIITITTITTTTTLMYYY